MQSSALRGLAVAALLAGTVLHSLPASAHAIVVSSSPALNATLPAGDMRAVLRFNSRIDAERSRLSLIRADGSAESLPLDKSAAPDELVARRSALPPGHYRLRWQVLAVDGHITRGDIPFTVKR